MEIALAAYPKSPHAPPPQKLHFGIDVGDAGFAGGDDLLEEFFIGADAVPVAVA